MAAAYDDWQDVLSAAYLRPRVGPTVIFVDDSALSSLKPDSIDASRDLADAVLSRIRLADGPAMFAPVMKDFRRWKYGSQADPPPVMPVIALTVLAAARMHSDADALSTNYYFRLAQTLTDGTDDSWLETVRNNLRGGGAFLQAVEMWQGLHLWVEGQEGMVGASTIRSHPHLQRIGFPLSQTLVRQSDRIAFTRFFNALQFPLGDPPESQILLGALDIWAAGERNRLSETLLRALTDTDLRQLLSKVVHAHAEAWDGRVLTNGHRQRIEIRLSIDLDAWETRWLFLVPPGGPNELTLRAPHSEQELELTAEDGLEYYSVDSQHPVFPGDLLRGLRLRGESIDAEFPASSIIFMTLDPQTGSWSSADGILPFEEHLAVVSNSLETQFREVLEQAASDSWRLVPQRGSVLLSGHTLFQNVCFTNGQKLDHVLSKLPGLRRVGVNTANTPRARLVRGLPIASSLSSKHYLVGGEPDLLLPSGSDSDATVATTVSLDGVSGRFQANGFPLELRRFINNSGNHVVIVEGQKLSFTTLLENPDSADPPGMATLGWTDDSQLSDRQQDFHVCGGKITEPREAPTVLARRGRDESWILHDDGRIDKLAEPSPPAFLSSIDVKIYLPCFEISVSASARWLAQRRGSRWQLTEIGSMTSNEYFLEHEPLSTWQRACSETHGPQLWKLQLQLAGVAQ